MITENVRVDNNGDVWYNAGNIALGKIGVRPWSSDYQVVELGGTTSIYATKTPASTNVLGIMQNAYIDADGTSRYIVAGAATRIELVEGVLRVYGAASGSVGGAITWTVAWESAI